MNVRSGIPFSNLQLSRCNRMVKLDIDSKHPLRPSDRFLVARVLRYLINRCLK